MIRCRKIVMLTLAASFTIGVSAASANVPGGNGALSLSFSDPTSGAGDQHQFLAWIDPQTGRNARPPVGPITEVDAAGQSYQRFIGRLYASPDGRHVAINSQKIVPFVPGATNAGRGAWQGAILGTNTALRRLISDEPVLPGVDIGGDLCRSKAEVVAALADGTFLWQRLQVRSAACYTAGQPNTYRTDYAITTPSGQILRSLLEKQSTNAPLSTSPLFTSGDDERTAYAKVSDDGAEGLYRVDLTTGRSVRLSTSLPMAAYDVSPDGRYIVGTAGDASLGIMRFDTRTRTFTSLIGLDAARALSPTANSQATPRSPVVSPDGRFVAFVLDDNDADSVVVMGINGTRPRAIRTFAPGVSVAGAGDLNWQPTYRMRLPSDVKPPLITRRMLARLKQVPVKFTPKESGARALFSIELSAASARALGITSTRGKRPVIMARATIRSTVAGRRTTANLKLRPSVAARLAQIGRTTTPLRGVDFRPILRAKFTKFGVAAEIAKAFRQIR